MDLTTLNLDSLSTLFDNPLAQNIFYILALFATLFLKSFIDNVKPGKAEKASHNIVLWIIRTIINKVSPEELGRKAALKVNPSSPNARRVSNDKKFTVSDAERLDKAVKTAKANSQGDWSF